MLGHRRLSIIDTDPRSSQPMIDLSGRWVVTYNGEIYNYREIRSELENLGWQIPNLERHRSAHNCGCGLGRSRHR